MPAQPRADTKSAATSNPPLAHRGAPRQREGDDGQNDDLQASVTSTPAILAPMSRACERCDVESPQDAVARSKPVASTRRP